MSPRWIIGLLFCTILLTIIGNVIEGVDALTSTQVTDFSSMVTGGTIAQASDPTVGGVITYANFLPVMVNGIFKAFTLQYSWMYDIDPVTHAKTPNEYLLVWAVIWWPIVLALAFMLVLELARLVRGAG